MYPSMNRIKTITVFGYSSKSIPGIEIVGAPRFGKMLKEKLIYLSRKHRLRLPLKRFVLCLDGGGEDEKFSIQTHRWLELPFLLIFWTLAGHLPIKKLDDCYTIGTVSVDSEVGFPKFVKHFYENSQDVNYLSKVKLIAPRGLEFSSTVQHLPLEALFFQIKDIKFYLL